MRRPSRDEVLMTMAETIAQRSTCERKQVGALAARDGRVLVLGYNGAPAGMPHCVHLCDCSTKSRTMPLDGAHWPTCPAGEPCTVAVHAEANTIAYAAKHGISLQNSTMYTTCSPCLPCAQIIINCGIVEVNYLEEYRDKAPIQLLREAGLKVWQLPR